MSKAVLDRVVCNQEKAMCFCALPLGHKSKWHICDCGGSYTTDGDVRNFPVRENYYDKDWLYKHGEELMPETQSENSNCTEDCYIKGEIVHSHLEDDGKSYDIKPLLFKVDGETSDGYHTFNELYEFRLLYNAALFNEWAAEGKWSVYKSRLHSDGFEPFGGGWFVVGAQLPTGQITNHYEDKDWNLFQVPELPRGVEWDGHTAADVAKRLRGMIEQTSFKETK
jgi:hypothetical protein